jgi:hypothetical protein
MQRFSGKNLKNRDHLEVLGTVEGMIKWIFNRSAGKE